MSLDVGVDASEVGLVEHGELELLFAVIRARCRGRRDGDVEVERPLKDRSIGHRLDEVEFDEQERLLEGVEYSRREEEQKAWSKSHKSARKLPARTPGGKRNVEKQRTILIPPETRHMICLLALPMRLHLLTDELHLARLHDLDPHSPQPGVERSPRENPVRLVLSSFTSKHRRLGDCIHDRPHHGLPRGRDAIAGRRKDAKGPLRLRLVGHGHADGVLDVAPGEAKLDGAGGRCSRAKPVVRGRADLERELLALRHEERRVGHDVKAWGPFVGGGDTAAAVVFQLSFLVGEKVIVVGVAGADCYGPGCSERGDVACDVDVERRVLRRLCCK